MTSVHPIREAFEQAEREKAEQEAARAGEAKAAAQAAQDYADDVASLKRAFRKGGLKMALAVGKTLGWRAGEIKTMLEPPAPPPAGDPGGGGDGRDGGPEPPPPPSEEGGEGWERDKKPIKPLPDDCPAIPLGHSAGEFHYLSPARQLVTLTKHDAEALRALFVGRNEWLWQHFPKFNERNRKQSGWKADRCGESLRHACAQKGIFNPFNRLRGLGGWRDDDGHLVLHLGDRVISNGEETPPGDIGGYVYTADEKAPGPATEGDAAMSARALLDDVDSWNWRPLDYSADGDMDPRVTIDGRKRCIQSLLLLGWIGGAFAGGALAWRSMVWITGDKGEGKSTLLDYIDGVVGAWLVKTGNATPAGVYAVVGHSSRPVALDEQENSPTNDRAARMVELAREASSGAMILRSSNDHKARGFNARSAFLFSSIIIPPMMAQDVSRMAILELAPLTPGAKPPAMDRVKLAGIGAQLRRRLIDNWPRWRATFDRYAMALGELGHDQRGQAQFGTLLAMADMMLFGPDEPDGDTVAELCAALARPKIAASHDAASNAATLLNHLLSIPLDVFRGGTRVTIGALVARAANLDAAAVAESPTACIDALAAHGVHVAFTPGDIDSARVALPNQHAGLLRLLADTQWRGAPGATGGWAQAMRRLPRVQPENSRRLGGRGWSVPAKVFLMMEER